MVFQLREASYKSPQKFPSESHDEVRKVSRKKLYMSEQLEELGTFAARKKHE